MKSTLPFGIAQPNQGKPFAAQYARCKRRKLLRALLPPPISNLPPRYKTPSMIWAAIPGSCRASFFTRKTSRNVAFAVRPVQDLFELGHDVIEFKRAVLQLRPELS